MNTTPFALSSHQTHLKSLAISLRHLVTPESSMPKHPAPRGQCCALLHDRSRASVGLNQESTQAVLFQQSLLKRKILQVCLHICPLEPWMGRVSVQSARCLAQGAGLSNYSCTAHAHSSHNINMFLLVKLHIFQIFPHCFPLTTSLQI